MLEFICDRASMSCFSKLLEYSHTYPTIHIIVLLLNGLERSNVFGVGI